MKKQKRKLAALLAAAAITVGLLAGCAENTDANNKTLLFTYDGKEIYMDEALMYVKTIQSNYEAYYGKDIWNYEVPDSEGKQSKFQDIVKKDVIEQIKMTTVLDKKAEELGVKLTAEDQEELTKQAKTFYEQMSDAEKASTGATEDLLIKIYLDNALADAVCNKISDEAKIDIPEEDCRQIATYNLLFATFKEDGTEQKDVTDKEKKAQKKRAKEALKRITDGEAIETVAADFGEYTDKSSNFNYGPKDTDVDKTYMEAASKLKDGEVSGIVETEFGYHIIKMIAQTDKDLTANKKETLVKKARREYFDKVYEGYVEELEADWDFERDVNQEAFRSITFHKANEENQSAGDNQEGQEATTAASSETEKQ